ncbi:hypothetical protein I302_107703 [Kwoniella bestiolae CBS 10118]|uniref:Uncharacterized protein n=1 Tax=Kwoniella bestiolae CBS 10118 TaxID=1296100 RepID=A0A1B9FXT3_9TREE|nr:hypothetical protein I302_06558 [Kwoniella bestiolae CBS 10118]OCF23575.1 hypothetical protein I302_06558 [Kwoniella bestiolae CBS 10118]
MITIKLQLPLIPLICTILSSLSVCAGAATALLERQDYNPKPNARPLYSESGGPNSRDIANRPTKDPWETVLFVLSDALPGFFKSRINYDGKSDDGAKTVNQVTVMAWNNDKHMHEEVVVSKDHIEGLDDEADDVPWWPESLLESIRQSNPSRSPNINSLPIEQYMYLFTGRLTHSISTSGLNLIVGELENQKQDNPAMVQVEYESKGEKMIGRVTSHADGKLKLLNYQYETIEFDEHTPDIKSYTLYMFDKHVTFPDES